MRFTTIASAALFKVAIASTTLTAYLPGSTLDGQQVEAGGFSFNLGTSGPATYCPTVVDPNCPPGNETVFVGGLSLSVLVPGGQQTYITPQGLISYTQAHSTSMPINSTIAGFTSLNVTSSDGSVKTLINYKSPELSSGGIFACPSGPSTYKIYGLTPEFNQAECAMLVGLEIHQRADNSVAAWQYV